MLTVAVTRLYNNDDDWIQDMILRQLSICNIMHVARNILEMKYRHWSMTAERRADLAARPPSV